MLRTVSSISVHISDRLFNNSIPKGSFPLVDSLQHSPKFPSIRTLYVVLFFFLRKEVQPDEMSRFVVDLDKEHKSLSQVAFRKKGKIQSKCVGKLGHI